MTTDSEHSSAHAKRRSFRQIMEEASGRILREALPAEWVVHGYAPDYGIDGVIEIFEEIEDLPGYSETLGESLFFQLKSTEEAPVAERQVFARRNVEKRPLVEDPKQRFEMEMVQLRLDTSELVTIQSMGSGVAVMLLLVCLKTERTYFLNLTDYIDKVLTPEAPDWRSEKLKTIRIPARNIVAKECEYINLLRFYGARPKLMGLFNRIHFQWAELNYGIGELAPDDWKQMVEHFAEGLLAQETWDHPSWEILRSYKSDLEELRHQVSKVAADELDQPAIVEFWFKLDTIGRTFEDVAREWGQPTALGLLSS